MILRKSKNDIDLDDDDYEFLHENKELADDEEWLHKVKKKMQ